MPPVELRCIVCSRKNPFGLICPSCKTKYGPDFALAAFKFQGSLRRLIHEFKYEDSSSLSSAFAPELVRLIIKSLAYRGYKIVPLPLTKRKLRFRGYNQSLLLARGVSRSLNLELTDVILRDEAAQTQVQSASRKERIKNIKGVFSLKGKPPEKVILIDDVITSGATVREATKMLKRAGTKKVAVFAIAM